MTARDGRVLQHYGIKLFREYDDEADFLSDAKLFVKMLDKSLVVREGHATVSGVSDLLICYHGRFVAAELKSKTYKATAVQKEFISKVQAAGGQAGECRTLNDVWTLLQGAVSSPIL